MKNITKLRAKVLSLTMVVMMLPMTMFAQQRSDDFFRVDDSFSGNRDPVITWTIVNNGIGQSEAPLGSGLLILTAVGAGYAVARRKSYTAYTTHKSYNSGATLVLALALLLGMTNCKKNVDTISSVPTNGVYITLNVDGGEKVAVNPTGGGTYATVTWEDGDILYVGNNGAYCGYLTYSGSAFSGTITPTGADDADYLHFYFMGNKGPVGSAPSSVNITDQTSKYPVISYGRSTSLYHSSTTSYSARLFNKCAIGKFTISGVDTDKAITITGMKNTVAVDFSKNGTGDVVNPYTYTKTGSGEIRLHAESNTVRWAILLPQDEVTTATAYASGYTSTSDFTVPAVSANGYYDSGVAVAMASGGPKGAFTINASGDQVFFAPGNLQYQASPSTWRFAEHQWDYVGSSNSSISSSYTGWIDLFGWGTSGISGYTPIATCYQPYSTSTNNNQYNPYGELNRNLYDGGDNAGKADWGYAASAANLGGYSTWRTLKNQNPNTDDEWTYIFDNRTTGVTVNETENARYTQATINTDGTGVNGIILFPDSYAGPTSSTTGITFGTINGASSWGTKCTIAGWASLEEAGCVFLPAAGRRMNGTSVSDVGSYGFYWSSSYNSNQYARNVSFNLDSVTPMSLSTRSFGCSVRLVRDV